MPELSDDPRQRIVSYLYEWHRHFKHQWYLKSDVYPPLEYAYAGEGWRETKRPNLTRYEHRMVNGEGDSAIAAIDDWWSKMPQEDGFAVVWRVEPELMDELDFDTKQQRYAVFSRFSIIPTADAV